MSSWRLTCELSPGDAELAVALWSRRGMLGCEDASGGAGVRLTAWFRDAHAVRAAARDISRFRLCGPARVAAVEDRDWNAAWRAAMRPVKLAGRIWVSPRWVAPPLARGEAWVRIEPKMAFGTGHHESTRLAARALACRGQRLTNAMVLDVGTGSGVLCFAASVMGAALCVGVESDPDCRGNLAENRRGNPHCPRVDFALATLDALKAVARFDVAVMNLILTEARPCLGPLARLVKPFGALVWSGLLADDREAALTDAAGCGFAPAAEIAENEWICGTFTRTTSGGGV